MKRKLKNRSGIWNSGRSGPQAIWQRTREYVDFGLRRLANQNLESFKIHGGSWHWVVAWPVTWRGPETAPSARLRISHLFQKSCIKIKFQKSRRQLASGHLFGDLLAGAGICAVGAFRTRAASWRLKREKKIKKA